jgi:glucosamine--fructose-6-phosphate aminotransferase (isomerizing)
VDAARRYWTAAGIEVRHVERIALGTSDTRGVYELVSGQVIAALQQLALDGIDAVLVTGTGMPSLAALREPLVSVPVVSSNSCLALPESLGARATEMLDQVENIHIVACGTSYHAGCVGKYWIESIAGVPCQVEIASEYRYRHVVVPPKTLFVTLSQSGETADTLEALRMAKELGYLGSLTICNSAHSSLVRESDLVMMTQAGPEIGDASTKAFTTQLLSILLVTLMMAKHRGLAVEREREFVANLTHAAAASDRALKMSTQLQELAKDFADKQHTLFLGRGPMWPIAMEGALKLKEISYIHAEAYAAGELKHGPLALIDNQMPVVVVAPNNELLDKLKSNMQVVRARGGQLYVFADKETGIKSEPGMKVIAMPHADRLIAPIVYTVPLQLLAYHVAVLKGTDVDQPRNLAKSVTVE